MKKVLKSVCMALIVSVAATQLVMADPLSDKLKTQKDQVTQNQQKVNDAQKKIDSLNDKIQSLDNQIEKLMGNIEDNKQKIKTTQSNLADVEKKVKSAEEDLQKEQEIFGERMSAMYKQGGTTTGYLQIILDSKGVRDLLSRVETVKKIAQLDADVKKDLNAKKEVLDKNKQALKDQNNQLVALQTGMQKDLDSIKNDEASQKTLIAQAQDDEKKYASDLASSKALVDGTMKQIKAIQAAAPKIVQVQQASTTIPSRGGYSAAPLTDNNIVAFAANYLGTKYVWGGTSPSGFDCSGFVQYVYAHFGVSLPRTTYAQINVGSTVSRDQLQPGDLIFFGTSSDPHHVGMYVGNGSYIHAPQTGDVVKISALGDFLTAKRVK